MCRKFFIPGSEWLYFQIYSGYKTLEEILISTGYEFIKEVSEKKIVDKYFFIRYNDPEPHIRLRFHLTEINNIGLVLSLFHSYFDKYVNSNEICNISINTYNRELERYGENIISETETIFYIDSKYLLSILREMHQRLLGIEDVRWNIALYITNDLLSAFQYNEGEKYEIMDLLASRYKYEFKLDQHPDVLNSLFRKHRNLIRKILIEKQFGVNDRILKQLEKRKQEISSVAKCILCEEKLLMSRKTDYVASLIHMSLNRLFRDWPRVHELVIYDMLRKYYKSESYLKVRNNKN